MTVIDEFHKAYYGSGVWATNTKWMGVPVQKCPLDLWVYQEIIHEVRPDLIIETGTAYGGSALFLASMCDIVNRGRIVTVDIAAGERPYHYRIHYITGDSCSDDTLMNMRSFKKIVAPGATLVILDSDHSKAHVLKELECYAPLVTPGSYILVEDTNVHGHPVCPDHGPGPFEAVEEFLKTHPEFAIDVNREKFLMTQNPHGYLRRIA